MTKRTDQIKLGAFLLFTGHHVAAWRHKDAPWSETIDAILNHRSVRAYLPEAAAS